MWKPTILPLCFAAFLSLLPLPAQEDMAMFFAPDGVEETSQLTQDSISASVTQYAAKESFYIGYTLSCEGEWHAYFRNPGTFGLALEFKLASPEGFKVEGPYWSMPERFVAETGTSYAYHQVEVVWQLTPEENAPAEAAFEVSSSAQLCSDTGCQPPSDSTQTISLSKADAASPNAQWQDLQKKVEHLGDAPIEVQAFAHPEGIELQWTGTADGAGSAYFFSEDNSIAPQKEQTWTQSGTKNSLILPLNDGSDSLYPAPQTEGEPRVQGLLKLQDSFVSLDIPVQEKPVVAVASGAESSLPAMPEGAWGVFASLFLGGLILNLMPCVFPVIGLKIMGFVELAGGSRRKVFFHSLAFVMGVLISFWLLSLILIILSKLDVLAQQPWTQWWSSLVMDTGAGDRTWAMWMQNPWVVYILLLILLVLGLSMYGLFEIGVSATGAGQGLQSKKGYSGSFFSGLLATAVATPCSAPFLGTALPAAMSMPALWMMMAMSCMALGLASPYLIIGLFPSLIRILPKPGAWMESLKQGLSFLIFAAVAWLLYVYIGFIPEAYKIDTPWMIVGLVVISAAFWVYGRWCPMYKEKGTRRIGFIVMLLLMVLGVGMSMPKSQAEEGSVLAQIEWKTWSPEAMNNALEQGKAVYVDYTATWCLTCQYNKKVAYSDKVYQKMMDHDIVLMRADKSSPNPKIDAELKKLNRSAVPVNVLYQKGQQPAITKEMLSADYLLEFLEEKLVTIHG